MTTQAVTDIKELVGEMPGQACECNLNSCGSRHGTGEYCGQAPQWMARAHLDYAEGGARHVSRVLAMCDECLNAAQAFVSHMEAGCRCSCGLPASDFLGPVMPL